MLCDEINPVRRSLGFDAANALHDLCALSTSS